MHQNTQFHIEKQKSSTPWEGGQPPPTDIPPLGQNADSASVLILAPS